MTTAELKDGSGLAHINQPENTMRERLEPTFVKFEEGEVCEGVLVSIQRVEVGDPDKPNAPKTPAIKYTLADPDSDEMYSFLGTYIINTKLRPTDKGHYVSVRFEGVDNSVMRNGNGMRRFKVLVSEHPVLATKGVPARGNQISDGTFITDDDIPF